MNALIPITAEPRSLRPYQERAIELLRQSLRDGHKRPALQIPTGGGKTRIAAEIINGALSKGRHAMFVVPRLSLIEQTVAAFASEGIWNVGVVQGRHFRTNPSAPVQIASAQTLMRREIPMVDLIIIDECHMQFRRITDWIAYSAKEWPQVPFIGLSATPWSKGLGKTYDDLLKPVTISNLIEDGFLSPFRAFAPPGPDLTGVRTTSGEFNESDLAEVCNTQEIVSDVVKTWMEKGENRPTLCYGVDRKHAQHLQERFIEAGVTTEYIDCDTLMFEREEIFVRFRDSETKLICNVATLDTGIDLDVRCIIDARPTKSRIRFVQTIGRGLRTAEGKDHLIILDHAGNHLRLGTVTDIDFDRLNNGESTKGSDRGKSGHDPIIKLCPECKCVLPPRARECPACGKPIFAATEVVEKEGHLVELGRNAIEVPAVSGWFAKRYFYGELKWIAREKAYAPGWVSHKYRERFGEWPNHPFLRNAAEMPPSLKTLNWIKSRQIAYAKERAMG
jgi:DNA repair protein RadD